MKKPYIPIRMPVCRCGRPARFREVRHLLYHVYPSLRDIGLHIPQGKNYSVNCSHCMLAVSAGTKRAAVSAFEKAVSIYVDG